MSYFTILPSFAVCLSLSVCVCVCVQIAFAAADSVTGLKLIEAGLPSERIALMALPMVPLQVTLPWIIR